ncbi:MAG TPA: hypothetical protein VK689_22225, partial [Armatimonadota bacterium]|nr:hypothetical protein [Armatimonadota bacterium]
TVETRSVGRKQSLIPQWSFLLPPDLSGHSEPLTLRWLITRVVLEEVRAFRERQDRRSLTQVLSGSEIEEGAARGKVDMGGRGLDQEVDDSAAVLTALQAFEDGLYLVILDGEEQRELDREVSVRPDSRVMFLRLALLAGG